MFDAILSPIRFVFGMIFSVFGAGIFGLLMIGGGMLVRHQTLPHAGDIQVEGTVSRVEVTESVKYVNGERETSSSTVAIIDYVDPATGQSYTTTSSSSFREPSVGDIRLVSFPPDNPADAHVLHAGFATVGLVLIGIGGLVLAVLLAVVVIAAIAGKKLFGKSKTTKLAGPAGFSGSPAWQGGGQFPAQSYSASASAHLAPADRGAAPQESFAAAAPVAQVSAGWYPDPHDSGQQRYWDGNAWTDYVE